jgi:3-methyladenine DNA glycosylase AlkD
LAALLVLVEQFQRGDECARKRIYELYLKETGYINNWDLVDLSAPTIVGEYLRDRSHKKLFTVAHSPLLWERRIAMVATFAFIRQGKALPTLALAKILLHDREDLIQKATGWMLREVGKRVGREVLAGFLDQYAGEMPRTMLRYALEHFPSHERARYMSVRLRGVK